ncbi:SDR family NAD(P)-dependent oxidoreductase [Planomonospora corallina]|uniref:SDR family NAD(P)-dependent oxidoreductase n=1 Tax=Planomonospora corallina TaxID=1806052 RepID=A0ABV8IEG2_9ACTN
MDSAVDWSVADLGDQTGRTFVVTGSSSGLGAEITRHLAARGGRVIMAVRDTAKGERVRDRLRAADPGADLDVRHLDLLDLRTVRRFADDLRADGVVVDSLVNNGGIGTVPHRLSPEGVESQLATNHLGHYALTGLLLDRMAEGGAVVTVASGLYRMGRLDLDDLAAERRYSPGGAYAASKLANVLFGLELDRRLRAAGSPVRSLVAHPGMARTGLSREAALLPRAVQSALGFFFRLPIGAAVAPILYAATEPAALTGRHIGPGRPRRPRPTFETFTGAAADTALAARLWDRSRLLTGVDPAQPLETGEPLPDDA